jgi:hypothetical protein
MNKPLGGLPLSVDDVFHRPWRWTRISRVEAFASGSQPVVVVSTARAMWFTRDSPFYRGVGPYDLRSLIYYRYAAVAERDHAAGGGSIRSDGGSATSSHSQPAGAADAAATGGRQAIVPTPASKPLPSKPQQSLAQHAIQPATTVPRAQVPLAALPVAAKKIACLLKSAVATCAHGRKPSVDGLLQVVPSGVGDRIALHAEIGGTCGRHPEWTVSGTRSGQLKGSDTSFLAVNWNSGKLWAAWEVPQDYYVEVASCAGESRSFAIQAFPADQFTFKEDFSTFEDVIKNIKDVLNVGLEFVSDDPPDPVEGPCGTIEVSASWQEYTDYRAFWQFQISANLDPLIRIQVEFPLNFVPPVLNKIGNLCLFLDLSGEIDAALSWGQQTPDRTSVSGGITGTIEARIGARLSLMHKGLLKVEVSVCTGVDLEINPKIDDRRPKLEIEAYWDRATGEVEVSALWDLFTFDHDVTFWDRRDIGSRDIDIIDLFEGRKAIS